MSPDQLNKFNEYFDLFGHPGWKRLMDDLEDNLQDVDTLAGLKDTLNLGIRQGKIQTLENILTLEDYMRAMYDELEEQDREAI